MRVSGEQEALGATQKPINPEEIGRGRLVLQAMYRDDNGKLMVHQVQGDARALIVDHKLRKRVTWHWLAVVVSTAAAVFGIELATIEEDPDSAKSQILDPSGRKYNLPDGDPQGGGSQSN